MECPIESQLENVRIEMNKLEDMLKQKIDSPETYDLPSEVSRRIYSFYKSIKNMNDTYFGHEKNEADLTTFGILARITDASSVQK